MAQVLPSLTYESYSYLAREDPPLVLQIMQSPYRICKKPYIDPLKRYTPKFTLQNLQNITGKNSERKHNKLHYFLECRKWGFKRWGFKQIRGYLRKKAFFLRFLDFPGALRTLRKRAKKAEKGRKTPISADFQEGRPDTPYTPICGSPKRMENALRNRKFLQGERTRKIESRNQGKEGQGSGAVGVFRVKGWRPKSC